MDEPPRHERTNAWYDATQSIDPTGHGAGRVFHGQSCVGARKVRSSASVPRASRGATRGGRNALGWLLSDGGFRKEPHLRRKTRQYRARGSAAYAASRDGSLPAIPDVLHGSKLFQRPHAGMDRALRMGRNVCPDRTPRPVWVADPIRAGCPPRPSRHQASIWGYAADGPL